MAASGDIKGVIEAVQVGDLARLRGYHDIDVNQLDDGLLALVEAVGAGAEFVELLLRMGAVNLRDAEGKTALVKACEMGNFEMVCMLLAAGADPNLFAVSMFGGTENPLREAVTTRSPQHLVILKELIRVGADVNLVSKSKAGKPSDAPLIAASRTGNVEAVRELLAAGADVNVAVSFGTALIRAAEEGRENVIPMLLEAGADPLARVIGDPARINTVGKNAAEVALMKGHVRVARMLGALKGASGRSGKLSEAWPRLETVLKSRAGKVAETLAGAADDKDLVELNELSGGHLPAMVRDFFRRHNGQRESRNAPFIRAGGVLYAKFRFMRISEVVSEWRMWCELTAGGEFKGRGVEADPGITAEWYNPGWLPLTTDGLGNSHCFDLSPAKGGQIGQIILLWHDQEERPMVAESLPTWLNDLADGLELDPT